MLYVILKVIIYVMSFLLAMLFLFVWLIPDPSWFDFSDDKDRSDD